MDINKRQEVKKANKLLYNKVADIYESIDKRRSKRLLFWLRDRLKNISEQFCLKTRLLDIGCGSGFVLRAAEGIFDERYGLDISYRILEKAFAFSDGVVCADVDFMPFRKESMDMVVLFSAMHHFYDHREMIKEVHRLLRQGGILYIDHDINKEFADRFRFLLWLYRKLSQRREKYIVKGIDEKNYDLSEFHSAGVDADKILNSLEEFGFKVCENYYHWYGLNPITDSIFKNRRFKKRKAPLMNIIAKKEK